MKQMTLIEMNGFLEGKCIPSDLKVNETNAEYMVRKFGELESKLETALRECRSAGITIDNLEAKCAKMAAENAGLYARTPVAYSYRYAWCETCDGFQDWRWELSKEKPPEWMLETGKVTNLVELFELPETPATDAFLAEVRAQGVEMFSALLAEMDINCTERGALTFAAKLRQNANSDMIHGSEPETDNTNQQFESLRRDDK